MFSNPFNKLTGVVFSHVKLIFRLTVKYLYLRKTLKMEWKIGILSVIFSMPSLIIQNSTTNSKFDCNFCKKTVALKLKIPFAPQFHIKQTLAMLCSLTRLPKVGCPLLLVPVHIEHLCRAWSLVRAVVTAFWSRFDSRYLQLRSPIII